MGEIIGIDLGTTNSVLAFLKGGPELINVKGRPSLPSVVALDGGEFLVGQSAKNLAASSDNVILSPKRRMGTDHKFSIDGQVLTPVQVSAMILKEIKKNAEEFLGEAVDTAVITIPAYFNHQQVDDTRKAAEEAGLKVGKLLAEPVAASATYGSGGEDTILVFDLGGGTLDCTVVDTFDAKIEGLAGDNWLGGDDFDNRIVDRMVAHLKEESGIDTSNNEKARTKLKQKAEEAKINLSEANSTQVEFIGKIDGQLCQIDFRLTREEYNGMISDLVDRAIEKADEAIKLAKMTKDDIDVVLLVGGSTLTPYVQERIEQHFGRPPSKKVNPMLAVGLGAAICTRDVPWDDKTHRVILRSRAEVWPEETYNIRGRTTAGSKVQVTGVATPVDTNADDQGSFEVEVNLKPNDINDVKVEATSPSGETARAIQRIRHDTSSDTKAIEPAAQAVIEATLPRTVILGLADERTAELMKAGTALPIQYENTEQFCCSANAIPFTLQAPVYEGAMPQNEIPYASFNTHMGTLQIQCPPTPDVTPMVVSLVMDESRNLTFKCWFKDDPSVFNEITLKPQSLARGKLHLLERVDASLKDGGEKIRPDERSRIQHKKQALIDLCEQYAGKPEMSPESEAIRKQIGNVGNELKSDIEALEQKYSI